jgi:cytochrome bd-type quinol oxidase subunit 1
VSRRLLPGEVVTIRAWPHRNQLPWQAQLAFAMVLTVVFIILVLVMLKSAKASSAEWQNLVYVFGSVEALVFTAIGWVFGREVQRAPWPIASTPPTSVLRRNPLKEETS